VRGVGKKVNEFRNGDGEVKRMRRACAVILLAGWYLLAPPMYESYNSKHKLLSTHAYANAPLPAWTNFGTYATREKCEAQRHNNFDDAIKSGPGSDARDQALWESSRNAMCISTSDPRTKR
jgi:hypothetical protein